MSDVLQLATKYRSRLKAELAKVDEFLRMAEELSKSGAFEGQMPSPPGNGNGEAQPKPAVEAAPKVEAKPKPAEEVAKTPFDRFRASGA